MRKTTAALCLAGAFVIGGTIMHFVDARAIGGSKPKAPTARASAKSVRQSADGSNAGAVVDSGAGTGRVVNTRQPTGVSIPDQPLASAPGGTDPDADSRRSKASSLIDASFGSFFRNLSARGIDPTTFRRMLIDREMIASDAIAVAKSQGIDVFDSQALRPVSEMIVRMRADALRQLKQADPVIFKEWQTFQNTLPERTLVAAMEQRLQGASEALTDQQKEQVVSILSHSPDERVIVPTRNAATGGQSTLTRVIPTSAFSALQGVLSPVQLEKLREMQREQISSGMRPVQ